MTEQQTAPAKANLEYSCRPDSFCGSLAETVALMASILVGACVAIVCQWMWKCDYEMYWSEESGDDARMQIGSDGGEM